jgi:hypothetical protein
MYNIIIKYELEGELSEGETYKVKFLWDKCIAAFYYRSTVDSVSSEYLVAPIDENLIGESPIDLIKKFDGETINMKFSGIVDGSRIKIFVLYLKEIERERKLKLLDI